MQLGAVILAGGNRESVISGAIESVSDCVDQFILIDTGNSARLAIETALRTAGDRCHVFKNQGDFDCATARNFGLDCAEKSGCDWALILDTDERIKASPGVIRRMLGEIDCYTVLIDDETERYKKVKFIRLPRAGSWSGIVHEAYVAPWPQAVAHGITFSEVPKSEQEEKARTAWIENQCRKAITDEPRNARWRYYLGDALAALGRPGDAVIEFLRAAKLSEWAEESAWSIHRAACLLGESGDRDALELALAISSDQDAQIPELPWYASVCAHRLGKHQRAIELAQRAAQLGESQRKSERIGFCNRVAWWEGPYDVLRYSYELIGDAERAAEAAEHVALMQAQRLSEAA